MTALLAGVSAAAVAGLVLVGSILANRRAGRVERRLAGYDVGDTALAAVPVGARSGPGVGAPETSVVQHGVALAERLAGQAGLLARTDRFLEEAGLSIRPAELLFYVPVFAALSFLLVAVIAGPLAGLLGGAAVALLPIAVVAHRRRSRIARFHALLPQTLTLLASSLRAGFSLLQGLEGAAAEASEPVRTELQRVFTEVRLGRTIEDSLADVARRMHSTDLAWTVMAVQIQREVGGNLAALLDTVAETMTGRERLRREIRTLTAEGRLSAVVLSIFPPLTGFALWLLRPDYVEILFRRAVGVFAVALATALTVVGWVWLRRIVDIED